MKLIIGPKNNVVVNFSEFVSSDIFFKTVDWYCFLKRILKHACTLHLKYRMKLSPKNNVVVNFSEFVSSDIFFKTVDWYCFLKRISICVTLI